MEFMTIIKAVTEFGFLIICGGIVIWEVLNDRKRQTQVEKNYDDFMGTIIDKLNEQNSAMLQQILNRVNSFI